MMNQQTLKKMATKLGANVCGIASVADFKKAPKGFHPTDVFSKAKSVVVVGKPFSRTVFIGNTNIPYTMVRNKLAEAVDYISFELCYLIEEMGFSALPIPSAEPYEHWETNRKHGKGILSLKHAAELAGMGRIGKNTLLINSDYGNRLWLGALITDIETEDTKPAQDRCITGCKKCLDACPVSALDGITIDQKKCREVSILGSEGGGYYYACNKCRAVCPFCLQS